MSGLSGLIGIIALLTVLGLSLVITRLAARALSLTGLSREAARFQARSAFTGTGFTTSEAEQVVNHPVRRQIIMLLMIARSAGLLSIVISLIFSFAGSGTEHERLFRLLWLVVGVLFLWFLARSRLVEKSLSKLIEWALQRWTDIDTRDYAGLLNLSGEYTVREMLVREGDWIEGKRLRDCRLSEEGVLVLGINRSDGAYVGAPRADTEIYSDDKLILYGRGKALSELDRRRADFTGERAHEEAVNEQKIEVARQEVRESEHKKKRQAKDSG